MQALKGYVDNGTLQCTGGVSLIIQEGTPCSIQSLVI